MAIIITTYLPVIVSECGWFKAVPHFWRLHGMNGRCDVEWEECS